MTTVLECLNNKLTVIKKRKFYLLGLFMALAPLFVSCSSDDVVVATSDADYK